MRLLGIIATGLALIVVQRGSALTVMPPPDSNHTALHAAAEKGDAAALRTLIKSLRSRLRSKELNRLDREGYTPLAYAARAGNLEIVELLVKSGASVDRTDEYAGWTPLMQAANQRHAAVVRYLLNHGANPNAVTRTGKTPLLAALEGSLFSFGAAGDRGATVRSLLEKGADPEPLLRCFDRERERRSPR